MTEPLKITDETLAEWDACPDGLQRFNELFPEGATLAVASAGLIADGHADWAYWLLNCCRRYADYAAQVDAMTFVVTREQVNADGLYTGPSLANWVGEIRISSGLGMVRFEGTLSASLSILAEAGSGIKAGWDIKAGLGIEAGLGIKAGWGIKAGLGIEAGWGIKAGLGIEAGSGIKAGWDIKAGRSIEAGDGIEAGLHVHAKTIKAKLRIFAGLCSWRLPTKEEMEIRGEVLSGTIAHGIHVPIEPSQETKP